MEVPRPGVESELQLPPYTTSTATQDPSHIWDLTIAHGHAGSLTHWVRPGIEPTSSWILVRFVTAEPQWECPKGYPHQPFIRSVNRVDDAEANWKMARRGQCKGEATESSFSFLFPFLFFSLLPSLPPFAELEAGGNSQDQELNPHHQSDPSCYSDNAGSLTHWATKGLQHPFPLWSLLSWARLPERRKKGRQPRPDDETERLWLRTL